MLETIVELLLGLISGGLITTLLMLKLNRRAKILDLKKQEINVEKIQDNFYRESIKSAYAQLTEVQKILDQVREELRITTERLANAEMMNMKLQIELNRAKTMGCQKALHCLDKLIYTTTD